MITTKKSLLAITLVSALGLGVAPTLYAQNDSEEKTESELETWEVSNPPYALNENEIPTGFEIDLWRMIAETRKMMAERQI